MVAAPAYKRILLKLSGEALMGDESYGIERETLDSSLMTARSALEQLGWQPHHARGIAMHFRRHTIRQLAIFTDLDKIEGFGEAAVEAAAEATTSHGMENFPIEELELGVRSYNCLKRVGIETIGDLTSKSEAELAAIPNFGRKSVEEVRETLAAHGLTLKGEELL